MTIILSGCGGGCDIFGCIPTFFELRDKNPNQNIVLISLSFTDLIGLKLLAKKNKIKSYNTENSSTLFKIDAKDLNPDDSNFSKFFTYFPEYFISLHLNQPVYLIIIFSSTIKSINQDYKLIMNEHKKIEEIYLIDGGCDALLSGRESDLATPVEDMMHLKALKDFKIKKYVCAIGMTCDCRRLPVSELEERLEYLEQYCYLRNVWSLEDPNVKKYYDIFNNSDTSNSIVHSLICARLEGKTGKYLPKQLKSRIKENDIELDDLIITFVKYNYDDLIKDFEYINDLEDEMTLKQVDHVIDQYILQKKKIEI